jgi:hypothetical protein
MVIKRLERHTHQDVKRLRDFSLFDSMRCGRHSLKVMPVVAQSPIQYDRLNPLHIVIKDELGVLQATQRSLRTDGVAAQGRKERQEKNGAAITRVATRNSLNELCSPRSIFVCSLAPVGMRLNFCGKKAESRQKAKTHKQLPAGSPASCWE